MNSLVGDVSILVTIVLIVLQFGGNNCRVVQTYSLNKGWTVTNENGSIKFTDVQLPNGVYTLLKAKNAKDDILLSYNDVKMRWVSLQDWIWKTQFDTPDSHMSRTFVNLTFHGIDAIASIKLNGEDLANTDNMFVRYSFNIKDRLIPKGRNEIEVRIKSPIRAAKELASIHPETPPECPDPRYNGECHMNFLRKMQASFAWDWGLAAPSIGLWKMVYLEVHDIAIIRDVDVATTLKGETWTMHIKVYLETGLQEPFFGELTMYAVDIYDDPIKVTFDKKPVDYRSPVIAFESNISSKRIKRWWPNGYGEQKLYHLHFTWNGWFSSGYNADKWSVSQKSIRIGFRTIELIQDQLPNGNTFKFRINGVDMFLRGSNWIPSSILPERHANTDQVNYLLKAAKDANLNMLRVWGGGVYESDYFYDMADFYGILIWQDMMFACAMYPVYEEFLKSVETETVQNALRIAYHPSIAIWATNNENEVALAQNWYKTQSNYDYFADNYRLLYVATVRHALSVITHSGRPDVLISSPSNGFKTIENNFLSDNPQDDRYGDVHYYNYMSDAWNPEIYPKPRFASEYGFQSMPSLTSWRKAAAERENLTDLIDHRQHFPLGSIPIIAQIKRHFNLPDESDPDYLTALTYLSQVSQAMTIKTETEHYRSLRSSIAHTMGALYWQLNDVWVAPSWSGIDFYGTFKILHYWVKEFMAPVSIIAQIHASTTVNVTVACDTIDTNRLSMTATMNILAWNDLLPKKTINWPFTMEPNSVQVVQSFELDEYLTGPYNVRNSFLQFVLQDPDKKILSTTYLFPTNFKSTVGIQDPNVAIIIANQRCQDKIMSVSLLIKVKSPALFVFIELMRTDIKKHSFSQNGFIQVVPIKTVHLEYEDTACETRPFGGSDYRVLVANTYLIS